MFTKERHFLSDKGLLPKIYNKHLKIKNKKTPQLKNGPKTLRDTKEEIQVASPHKKRFSASHTFEQWYRHTPRRTARIRMTAVTRADKMCNRKPPPWLSGTQEGTATVEGSLVASYKTQHSSIAQSRNQILVVYLRELETCRCEACTQMFLAALFIIANTWKPPRYPPAD